ncbi:MAG: polyisoprenoid-binding protein [Bdellovibrionales bacterium]|nr:polyisoprenoid-binding protein [Bdellovibrionales bacterium]
MPTTNLWAETYQIDSAHSSVGFEIRHFLNDVSGHFSNFTGTIDYDSKNPKNMNIKGEVQVESINTGVEKRDSHLKSADFFDLSNPKKPEYQHIRFQSKKIKKVTQKKENTQAILIGDLTIHGITKEVALDLEIRGPAKDPFGNIKIAVDASGVVNRKDFGLNWSAPVEAGNILVGEDVKIQLKTQAIQEAAKKEAQDAEVKKPAKLKS